MRTRAHTHTHTYTHARAHSLTHTRTLQLNKPPPPPATPPHQPKTIHNLPSLPPPPPPPPPCCHKGVTSAACGVPPPIGAQAKHQHHPEKPAHQGGRGRRHGRRSLRFHRYAVPSIFLLIKYANMCPRDSRTRTSKAP